jgi:hypothetical protein
MFYPRISTPKVKSYTLQKSALRTPEINSVSILIPVHFLHFSLPGSGMYKLGFYSSYRFALGAAMFPASYTCDSSCYVCEAIYCSTQSAIHIIGENKEFVETVTAVTNEKTPNAF